MTTYAEITERRRKEWAPIRAKQKALRDLKATRPVWSRACYELRLLGFSQKRIAEALGVTPDAVAKWEKTKAEIEALK